MKDTIVISAFPACGKTWITENNSTKKVLDSDSSEFSWTVDAAGNKVRDTNFPDNYIKHIKDNIGDADVIFVSSHLTVREALKTAGIRFVAVYPESNLKHEWIGRCYCRGNDLKFIEFINSSWDKFMDSVISEPTGDKLYRLQAGEHLSDIMNSIAKEWRAKTRLNDMADDDAPLLELSDEDIDDIAADYAVSKSKRVNKRYYHISKHKNEIYISVTQTLDRASSYYRKPGCDFLKYEPDYYFVWSGGYQHEITNFCKPFMKIFLAQVEKICSRLGLTMTDEQPYSSVSVDEDGLLYIDLSINAIEK